MSDKYYFDFSKENKINKPLRFFFLCGSDYSEENKRDKRKVLKDFIEQEYKDNCFGLILEEDFTFSKDETLKIDYINDLGMNSLKDIELLTTSLSDRTIVLHESLSTSAEIGLFSHNDFLLKKLLVLTPTKYSVESDYMTGFLKLAYQFEQNANQKINNIFYYPEVRKTMISDNVSKYHTYFYQDKIEDKLRLSLLKELDFKNEIKISKLKKSNFRNYKENKYQLVDDHKIKVELTVDSIKVMILSILSEKIMVERLNNSLRQYFLERGKIYNSSNKEDRKLAHFHVSNELEKIIKELVKNYIGTVSIIKKSAKIEILLIDFSFDLNKLIKFYFNLLYVFKFLQVSKTKNNDIHLNIIHSRTTYKKSK